MKKTLLTLILIFILMQNSYSVNSVAFKQLPINCEGTISGNSSGRYFDEYLFLIENKRWRKEIIKANKEKKKFNPEKFINEPGDIFQINGILPESMSHPYMRGDIILDNIITVSSSSLQINYNFTEKSVNYRHRISMSLNTGNYVNNIEVNDNGKMYYANAIGKCKGFKNLSNHINPIKTNFVNKKKSTSSSQGIFKKTLGNILGK